METMILIGLNTQVIYGAQNVKQILFPNIGGYLTARYPLNVVNLWGFILILWTLLQVKLKLGLLELCTSRRMGNGLMAIPTRNKS